MKLTQEQIKTLVEYYTSLLEPDKAETPKTKTVYDLEPGDKYFYIDTVGCIQYTKWDDDYFDHYRRKTHNCFLTEQECQDKLDYINAEADYLEFIREWNKGEVIDWKDNKQIRSYLFYNHRCNFLNYTRDYETQSRYDKWYFLSTNTTIVENFIEAVTSKLGKDKVILAITGKKL